MSDQFQMCYRAHLANCEVKQIGKFPDSSLPHAKHTLLLKLQKKQGGYKNNLHPKELNHEDDPPGHREHLRSATAPPAGKFSTNNSHLAAQHGICRGRAGDVQRCGIQMYSSPHLASWMGAAECSGSLATCERHSWADSNTHTDSNSNTHTTPKWRWRLHECVECEHHLQRARDASEP